MVAPIVNKSAESTYLGISVDESFAEFSLIDATRPSLLPQNLAQHRIYFSRESLKSALPAFLATHRALKPQKVFVSLRFLEKILEYRLGGSVAQLVTEGFENWLQIRSHHPSQQSLSNPEMIFPVKERTSADGEVLQELSLDDLETLAAKLKALEVKRICIHFLHSQLQPQNLQKAQAFFEERGFDVFVPQPSDNEEITRWRANTLNASISGTFLELKEQIETACQEFLTPENIFFLSAQKKTFQNQKEYRLGSLFSTRTAVIENETAPSLLYLGLEKFSWIEKESERFWQSHWGPVELTHPRCLDLQIQPTSRIDLNLFGELDFSLQNDGFEPGPMTMGRGQKPTLLDLYAEDPAMGKILAVADRINPAGIQRFKNTLLALAKSSLSVGKGKSTEVETIRRQLKEVALQRLGLEVHLQNPTAVHLVGPLASLLGPDLQKKYPEWTINADPFIDSRSVVFAGLRWLSGKTK